MFKNKDTLNMKNKELRNLRGEEISMIFQDPTTHLNPTMRIGEQIAESLIIHKKMGKQEAYKRTLEMLRLVKISNPQERINNIPMSFQEV